VPERWFSLPDRRRVPILLIAGTVIALAAAFLKIADAVRESEVVVRIDQNTLELGMRHRAAWLTTIARAVTVLGNGWMVAVVIAISASALALRHRRTDALFVLTSVVGAAIAVAIVKHAVGRPRPALPDRLATASGAAFPSGHAAQSIACYGALAVVLVTAARSNRLRAFAIAGAVVVAFAIGASRIYLGVHWLSDVVGGWLLAAGWLLALIGARSALAHRRAPP
jgi:membrane-associated phospholipid phosphatase